MKCSFTKEGKMAEEKERVQKLVARARLIAHIEKNYEDGEEFKAEDLYRQYEKFGYKTRHDCVAAVNTLIRNGELIEEIGKGRLRKKFPFFFTSQDKLRFLGFSIAEMRVLVLIKDRKESGGSRIGEQEIKDILESEYDPLVLRKLVERGLLRETKEGEKIFEINEEEYMRQRAILQQCVVIFSYFEKLNAMEREFAVVQKRIKDGEREIQINEATLTELEEKIERLKEKLKVLETEREIRRQELEKNKAHLDEIKGELESSELSKRILQLKKQIMVLSLLSEMDEEERREILRIFMRD